MRELLLWILMSIGLAPISTDVMDTTGGSSGSDGGFVWALDGAEGGPPR
jgi:hypothetical protein